MKELIKILTLEDEEVLHYIVDLYPDSAYISKDKYVMIVRDEIYPFLVAHADTVYSERNFSETDILFNGVYAWSPFGIGGDDRAGVWACLKLFKELKNVNLLITNYEETGGLGAKAFCQEQRSILEKTPYLIEIDRRGYNQAVFYNEEEITQEEFYHIVSAFFECQVGSFSDISIIGYEGLIASVNLSAGFYNEHCKECEFIHIPSLLNTIEKVPKLIEALGLKQYKLDDELLYVSYPHGFYYGSYFGYDYDDWSYYYDYEEDTIIKIPKTTRRWNYGKKNYETKNKGKSKGKGIFKGIGIEENSGRVFEIETGRKTDTGKTGRIESKIKGRIKG